LNGCFVATKRICHNLLVCCSGTETIYKRVPCMAGGTGQCKAPAWHVQGSALKKKKTMHVRKLSEFPSGVRSQVVGYP
jgi:hypothetical protein